MAEAFLAAVTGLAAAYALFVLGSYGVRGRRDAATAGVLVFVAAVALFSAGQAFYYATWTPVYEGGVLIGYEISLAAHNVTTWARALASPLVAVAMVLLLAGVPDGKSVLRGRRWPLLVLGLPPLVVGVLYAGMPWETWRSAIPRIGADALATTELLFFAYVPATVFLVTRRLPAVRFPLRRRASMLVLAGATAWAVVNGTSETLGAAAGGAGVASWPDAATLLTNGALAGTIPAVLAGLAFPAGGKPPERRDAALIASLYAAALAMGVAAFLFGEAGMRRLEELTLSAWDLASLTVLLLALRSGGFAKPRPTPPPPPAPAVPPAAPPGPTGRP